MLDDLFDALDFTGCLWSWKALLFVAAVAALVAGFFVPTWPMAIGCWVGGVILLLLGLWAAERDG